jgi:enoyl-CoA hydratase
MIYEKLGRVARVTLNRPEKLNAINEELRRELEAAIAQSEEDREVRVVVLRGVGRAFCVGYDISDASTYGGRDSFSDWIKSRQGVQRWLRFWNSLKPTIAGVHGYCLAGGTELAGHCDLVIAAEDAEFGHPAGRAIGIPDTLGLWPVHIGMRKSKELLFTGKSISGREAERIGLINLAVPADKLEETVMEWAEAIARMPVEALVEHKYIVNRWFEIMGLPTAVMQGADFDAIYHQTEAPREFWRLVKEKGLKVALEWRDSPFGDFRGAKK